MSLQLVAPVIYVAPATTILRRMRQAASDARATSPFVQGVAAGVTKTDPLTVDAALTKKIYMASAASPTAMSE